EDGTTAALVKALSPSFAVISAGADNTYGLPDPEVLVMLSSVSVFRTDQMGTIVATCESGNLSFNVPTPLTANAAAAQAKADAEAAAAAQAEEEAAAAAAAAANQEQSDSGGVTVYTTNTGKKYHRDGCQYLNKSKIPISLGDAKAQGLGACSKCGPPQ
ncbi:MAG: hypothetical protein RR842_05145, partial [Gordonibacter sp.]